MAGYSTPQALLHACSGLPTLREPRIAQQAVFALKSVESIIVSATVEHIALGTAEQCVIAFVAIGQVKTVSSGDTIRPSTTMQLIIAIAAREIICTIISEQ